MKAIKLFALSILMLSFLSCDPEYCYDYIIHNNSEQDIELFFYDDENTSISIHQGKEFTQLSTCGLGKSSLGYDLVDSIQIKVDDIVKRTYYPTDEGKNIFKTQNLDSWKLVESGKRYAMYQFEITEEDLR